MLLASRVVPIILSLPGTVAMIGFPVLVFFLLVKVKRKYVEKAIVAYQQQNNIRMELIRAGMRPCDTGSKTAKAIDGVWPGSRISQPNGFDCVPED